jgi:hypothetical protein
MWKRALVLAGLAAAFASIMIGIGVGQVISARGKLRRIAGNDNLQITEAWNTGACGTFQLSPRDAKRPYDLQEHPFLAGVTPDGNYLKAHPGVLDAERSDGPIACIPTHARHGLGIYRSLSP